MAKYSIDSDNSDESSETTGDSCELCGKQTDGLKLTEVAGATVTACTDCAPDDGGQDTRDADEGNRTAEAIRRATDHSATPDSSWAESADYSDDPLPYLVDDYGDMIEEARTDADLSQKQLADEVGLGVAVLRVLENGQATSANIGRSDVEAVGDHLDINIIAEV